MCHNNLKGRETEYMQNICRIYAENLLFKAENKNVSGLLIKC